MHGPETTAQEREALLLLCRRHGVAPSYHDIWGRERLVPEQGLRALLRAMGVEAGDAAQVQASLTATEGAAHAQLRPLPPVAVFRDDGAPRTLTLQAAAREGALHWALFEEDGRLHEGEVEDFRVTLPAGLPAGYHRLELRGGPEPAQPASDAAQAGAPTPRRLLAATLVVVAPGCCFVPPALAQGRRVWGPAVQLYALRSQRNWGIGDFTDLARLVRMFGARGAGVIGLNPLHALFPHDPSHASPYAPSSRRFLDILYIDVEAVEEFAVCAEARDRVLEAGFQARLRTLRAADLVDYRGVAAAKLPILELLYAHFRREHAAAGQGPRLRDFRAFQAASGPALRRHAIFEALQEHFYALDPQAWGWPQWPYAYRDPESPQVAAFAAAHAERVEYFEYLQWLAECQLAAAGAACMQAQLAVGLYQDLAVSVDRGGADAWGAQDLYVQSASAGCPPDDFNLHGQDWGLPPLNPERLQARAYGPFIAALRANMRHAGALRIDHVMGLARLFWVPRGDLPDSGAYVSYPFEDLLAIVALESQRNRCMVIGEDLGTVPDEVREGMHRGRLLSYRLLYFTRDGAGGFLPPRDYPADALVASSTHDLATLVGFWEGRDIELRQDLGLFPSEAVHAQQTEQRKRDCALLVEALRREALLPLELNEASGWPLPMTPALAFAVQQYLARTPARVQVVQLEDIFGARDQVNVPGTVDQYPNWRRKLPLALERWEADGRVAELARRLIAERGS